MNSGKLWIVVPLVAFGGVVCAQSTGSFSSPSTGSGAAGGSPVGMVLPYTVQSGSTAPTQPGHTITGDRTRSASPAHASSREPAAEGEKDKREQDVAKNVK